MAHGRSLELRGLQPTGPVPWTPQDGDKTQLGPAEHDAGPPAYRRPDGLRGWRHRPRLSTLPATRVPALFHTHERLADPATGRALSHEGRPVVILREPRALVVPGAPRAKRDRLLPMDPYARVQAYVLQNDGAPLTARQRRAVSRAERSSRWAPVRAARRETWRAKRAAARARKRELGR